MLVFFQDLEGLTKVFRRMSAPFWADFSFLNDENHRNPGCKPRVPQTTGFEMPDQIPPYLGVTRFSRKHPQDLEGSGPPLTLRQEKQYLYFGHFFPCTPGTFPL